MNDQDMTNATLVSSKKVEVFGKEYELRLYRLPSPYNHHTVRLVEDGKLLDSKRSSMLVDNSLDQNTW